MVYYGTGNPGLWSPSYRCSPPVTQENCNSGKSDNKWSMTIFARNVEHRRGVMGLPDDAVRPVGL